MADHSGTGVDTTTSYAVTFAVHLGAGHSAGAMGKCPLTATFG